MNVRSIIVKNKYKGFRYKIDGILYNFSIDIPEIVRDGEVEFYEVIDGIMIIKTKERKISYCLKF